MILSHSVTLEGMQRPIGSTYYKISLDPSLSFRMTVSTSYQVLRTLQDESFGSGTVVFTQSLFQFFQKFLCVAGLDEIFAEQFLQALQVIAAIACEHDHFLEAVAVA